MSSSLGDVADLAVEWVVPTVVLTVPGVLVMLAVAGQALGAAIFIPLTRRSLGGFGLSAVRGRGRRPGRF
jgi:hypothetical protein